MTPAAVEERPATETPADERPVHLARCAECSNAVSFRQSASGASFTLVDAGDASYGIGEHGRPLCPNGHGEMAIADDQIPAADAFALAQERLDAAEGPVQRTLPGVVPPFNYEGAYLELEAKALEVDRLHREYKDAAEEARDAKKNWDKAAELYTSMALELRRRRREKVGAEPDAADVRAEAARVPCAWEQAHQEAADGCPVCRDAIAPMLVSRFLHGDPSTATDAAEHVTEVDRVLTGIEVEEVVAALDSINVVVKDAVVAEWSPEDRKAVALYADAKFDELQDVPETVIPERPAVLGRPHIPAEAVGGAAQVCQFCEVVLVPGGDDPPYYAVTDYIGVDCEGKVQDAPRYQKSKKSAKKKTGKGRR